MLCATLYLSGYVAVPGLFNGATGGGGDDMFPLLGAKVPFR